MGDMAKAVNIRELFKEVNVGINKMMDYFGKLLETTLEKEAILESKELSIGIQKKEIKSDMENLKKERIYFESIQSKIDSFNKLSVIPLNIGGKNMDVGLETLRSIPSSMLSSMFSGRHNFTKCLYLFFFISLLFLLVPCGRYFIDRDSKAFNHVVSYLRDKKFANEQISIIKGTDPVLYSAIIDEFDYFCIPYSNPQNPIKMDKNGYKYEQISLLRDAHIEESPQKKLAFVSDALIPDEMNDKILMISENHMMGKCCPFDMAFTADDDLCILDQKHGMIISIAKSNERDGISNQSKYSIYTHEAIKTFKRIIINRHTNVGIMWGGNRYEIIKFSKEGFESINTKLQLPLSGHGYQFAFDDCDKMGTLYAVGDLKTTNGTNISVQFFVSTLSSSSSWDYFVEFKVNIFSSNGCDGVQVSGMAVNNKKIYLILTNGISVIIDSVTQCITKYFMGVGVTQKGVIRKIVFDLYGNLLISCPSPYQDLEINSYNPNNQLITKFEMGSYYFEYRDNSFYLPEQVVGQNEIKNVTYPKPAISGLAINSKNQIYVAYPLPGILMTKIR